MNAESRPATSTSAFSPPRAPSSSTSPPLPYPALLLSDPRRPKPIARPTAHPKGEGQDKGEGGGGGGARAEVNRRARAEIREAHVP
eukprot:553952-Pyramimonas_sp.AAC.1